MTRSLLPPLLLLLMPLRLMVMRPQVTSTISVALAAPTIDNAAVFVFGSLWNFFCVLDLCDFHEQLFFCGTLRLLYCHCRRSPPTLLPIPWLFVFWQALCRCGRCDDIRAGPRLRRLRLRVCHFYAPHKRSEIIVSSVGVGMFALFAGECFFAIVYVAFSSRTFFVDFALFFLCGTKTSTACM